MTAGTTFGKGTYDARSAAMVEPPAGTVTLKTRDEETLIRDLKLDLLEGARSAVGQGNDASARSFIAMYLDLNGKDRGTPEPKRGPGRPKQVDA